MKGRPKRLTPIAFLRRAGPGKSTRLYLDKEVIYSQESPPDAIFYIHSGIVKLTVISKRRRKKAVLAILGESDFFGEGCLGKTSQRLSTAASIGPSIITRVEKEIFRRKIEQDAAFGAMFMRFLLARNARLKADLEDRFFNSSERRLARILLMIGSFGRKSKGGASVLPISQGALAEMVGTTRERVSSFMNKFREKGYIKYNGTLEIDPDRLTAFLQG